MPCWPAGWPCGGWLADRPAGDRAPVAPESAPGQAGLIVARALEQVRPGSIILLHVMYESRVESRAALPEIIDGLLAKGYRFATVSELLAAGESAE